MHRRFRSNVALWRGSIVGLICGLALLTPWAAQGAEAPPVVDATTLKGTVMCGYQGWFRCPGDAANQGWQHWSRDRHRLAPQTLTFEMWPDLSEYSPGELFSAQGFTHADGKPAFLFSSDNAATVDRHFAWMRDYGIDGAWLQHFVVDLPGGSSADRFAARSRVLRYVADAAQKAGRVWALSYDVAGCPEDKIYDILTTDWQRLAATGIVGRDRYLHHQGRPVVQIWGYYANNSSNAMTPALATRLFDFFKADGAHAAYLVGGGDWDWRRNKDPEWQAMYRRMESYAPWNVGNYALGPAGERHASIDWWKEDKRQCDAQGTLWMPVVYPGFSWDNLRQQPPGTSTIPRLGGRFLWEQFHALTELQPDSIYVAMFDEVDEGTAIFKVTSSPPVEAHFVGYEGLPSDWYLRLVGAGAQMVRGKIPATREIPIKP
jgi:hypothetical protein